MKTCISEKKLMRQFEILPFSKIIPLFLSNFFMNPSLCKYSKQETPLILGGNYGKGDESGHGGVGILKNGLNQSY